MEVPLLAALDYNVNSRGQEDSAERFFFFSLHTI